MKSKPIEGATRVMGGPGLEDLHIRDTMVKKSHLDLHGVPCMSSAWEPSPEELQRIKQGAPIILRIIGTDHPPVAVEVGAPKSKIIMPG
ncbi:MAG: hypothetical protein CGW95_00980 [Phenylobacterium zucineum]|nr:MAG: hypothetical protein CGW95_00980 [Phenylobacterium zucineum]